MSEDDLRIPPGPPPAGPAEGADGQSAGDGEGGEQRPPSEPAPRRLLPAVVLGMVIVAGLVLTMLVLGGSGARPRRYEHRPRLLLAPDIHLLAVMRDDQKALAGRALHQAEAAIRDVETRMGANSDTSEVLRLNAARPGEKVPLSPPVIELLRACRELNSATRGAFDVTVLPLRRLWEQAAKDGRLPSREEVAAARKGCGWDRIDLLEDGAVRKSDSAGLDLEEAARGWAADRAADVLRAMGAAGGVVEVGGNMRCFGRREKGLPWDVDVLDPHDPRGTKVMMRLAVGDGAVCTSSHYSRWLVIGDRSYSRVLNPSTGWPATGVVSATVVAPDCLRARAWAEALRVLGEGGLKLLPAGVEAMLVVGTAQSRKVHVSDGFQKYTAAAKK